MDNFVVFGDILKGYTHNLIPVPAIILAILLVLGGGVSTAAQSALPGSALYPVKIGINEKVGMALSFSDQSKAAYEATLTERRLSEAEQLAVSASVSADVLVQLQANFKAFADRTQARITALAATDPQAAADLASNFETALRAHDKVIARMAAHDTQSTTGLGKLQVEVDSELSDTVKVRMNAEKDMEHGRVANRDRLGHLFAAVDVRAAEEEERHDRNEDHREKAHRDEDLDQAVAAHPPVRVVRHRSVGADPRPGRPHQRPRVLSRPAEESRPGHWPSMASGLPAEKVKTGLQKINARQ